MLFCSCNAADITVGSYVVQSETSTGHTVIRQRLYVLDQRFPTFLTPGALFRINFYGGAP